CTSRRTPNSAMTCSNSSTTAQLRLTRAFGDLLLQPTAVSTGRQWPLTLRCMWLHATHVNVPSHAIRCYRACSTHCQSHATASLTLRWTLPACHPQQEVNLTAPSLLSAASPN